MAAAAAVVDGRGRSVERPPHHIFPPIEAPLPYFFLSAFPLPLNLMATDEPAAAAEIESTDGGGKKKGGCCQVNLRTIALAVFGIGIVGAVIVWGIIRTAGSSGAAANRTISIPIELRPSSILHIWLKTRKPEQSQPAHIQLIINSRRNSNANNGFGGQVEMGGGSSDNRDSNGDNKSDKFLLAQSRQHTEFEFHEVAPRLEGQAMLEWVTGDTWVSYIYVYEPESVLELGIRPAFIAAAARNPEFSEGYHFRPPLGWMNDPNGFSKLGPYFHLFYQHYPHTLYWSAMHWGHAVSRDLVNWVHLPEFLLPDPSVGLENEGRGGIFSGSAIPLAMPSGLRVFFTDASEGRSPMQFQRMVTSLDSIHPFGRAQTIIPEGPPGLNLTQDFRDPNVVMGPDGKWKMVLGSRDDQGGVMLLYGTDDPQAMAGWQFLSVLFRDNRLGMTVAECSGLVPIDGDPRDPNTLWALIYAQLDSTDPRTGRRDLSPVIVGTFDGIRFRPMFEQEMDFGTHAYAFQAFHSQSDGTLVIAWLASWKDWDWNTKPDFPTAMTLPRRMLLSRDRRALLTPPVDTVVAALRAQRLDDGRLLQKGQPVELPNGTAEVQLQLGGSTGSAVLRLELGHPRVTSPIGVEISPEGVEILPGTVKEPTQRLIALGARPREVQVLLDTGSIEVFADGGRWAGTVRIPGADKFTSIRLSGDLDVLSRSEVWALRPAQFRGKLQQQQQSRQRRNNNEAMMSNTH